MVRSWTRRVMLGVPPSISGSVDMALNAASMSSPRWAASAARIAAGSWLCVSMCITVARPAEILGTESGRTGNLFPVRWSHWRRSCFVLNPVMEVPGLPGPVVPYDALQSVSVEQAAGMWPAPTVSGQAGASRLSTVTVMSAAAWDTLVREGQLVQSWANVDPEWRAAYGWMSGQMAARGLGGDAPPVWLWAQIDPLDFAEMVAESPDFGEGQVVVFASIPAKRCLLSSFGEWHAVLNRMWCAPPGTVWLQEPVVDESWEGLVVDSPDQDALPFDVIEASWQWCLVPDVPGADPRIQVTVPALRAADVAGAVRTR